MATAHEPSRMSSDGDTEDEEIPIFEGQVVFKGNYETFGSDETLP